MMKKICLSLLAIFTIFSVGIAFADVIFNPSIEEYLILDHDTSFADWARKRVEFQNVEIDNYKLIIQFYDTIEPAVGEWEWTYRLKSGKNYKFYLVDKSAVVKSFTQNDIQNLAILIWNLKGWWRIGNPFTFEKFLYRIVKNGDNYELELVGKGVEKLEWANYRFIELCIEFWIVRLITILIETIVLFIIAKLFRRKDQVSNWRLLLIGILASTITLPLLWFIFPLFIVNEVLYTVIWELSVTLIEIFIIKYWLKVSRWKAIIASIVCNLCSYLVWVWLLIF